MINYHKLMTARFLTFLSFFSPVLLGSRSYSWSNAHNLIGFAAARPAQMLVAVAGQNHDKRGRIGNSEGSCSLNYVME
ncbi:hypothetical protein F5144DRAFT_195157 [Chaetomium tenue]|uniref:Uncharacterized protein n=1 Tax=Chaetomium tenue TaxID=1854479 RepID=A0ACB7PDE2_9PEZI|nr:hypothetical protein F5144DRAFT_195157 [Chaetomium globosum]